MYREDYGRYTYGKYREEYKPGGSREAYSPGSREERRICPREARKPLFYTVLRVLAGLENLF